MENGGRQRGRQAELAAFLRAQRAGLRPSDVGLPEGAAPARRRTPGLRREEIAELAGISVTWYTWLEQGRNISTSAQVIDALARALSLDDDQHRYLRDLAGLPAPERKPSDDHAQARLRRLVDAAAPNVASVYDVNFDYLAWNKPYALIRHDPGRYPRERRNLLWMMFTDAEIRTRLIRWEPAARSVLSQFRAAAGRHPGDPRFASITRALSETSAEFREWWTEYPVRSFRPAIIGIDHPEAGRLDLELFQLHPAERPDLLLVMQVPVGKTALRRITALLGTA
ncbi:helix-turn-helix transcriptional regulator [Nonomuraea sp. NBC_00507]|uniref:helix-turn-helix transcriptional regulator n=1 Tax=Nonomuraea sp. NBC_00507 TaxID=2976002 RepID=UPI002E19D384